MQKVGPNGVVCESLGHDSYLVRMDGSGRVSRRNRRFLRAIQPYKDIINDLEKDQKQRTMSLDRSEQVSSGTGRVWEEMLLASGQTMVQDKQDRTQPSTGDHVDVRTGYKPTGLCTEVQSTSPTGGRPPTGKESGGKARHVARQETERIPAAAPTEINTDGEQRGLERDVAIKADIVTRPVRNRKKPDFLVVGDTKDPRFNRKPGQ